MLFAKCFWALAQWHVLERDSERCEAEGRAEQNSGAQSDAETYSVCLHVFVNKVAHKVIYFHCLANAFCNLLLCVVHAYATQEEHAGKLLLVVLLC